jgi:hypothetical protein
MDPTVTELHACRNLPSLKNPELFGPLLLFWSLCPECEQTRFVCISMAWMSIVSPSYHTYTIGGVSLVSPGQVVRIHHRWLAKSCLTYDM